MSNLLIAITLCTLITLITIRRKSISILYDNMFILFPSISKRKIDKITVFYSLFKYLNILNEQFGKEVIDKFIKIVEFIINNEEITITGDVQRMMRTYYTNNSHKLKKEYIDNHLYYHSVESSLENYEDIKSIFNIRDIKEKTKETKLCPICSIKLFNKKTHGDHYRSKDEYPDLANDKNNLIITCLDCNQEKNRYDCSRLLLKYFKSIDRFNNYVKLEIEFNLQRLKYIPNDETLKEQLENVTEYEKNCPTDLNKSKLDDYVNLIKLLINKNYEKYVENSRSYLTKYLD